MVRVIENEKPMMCRFLESRLVGNPLERDLRPGFILWNTRGRRRLCGWLGRAWNEVIKEEGTVGYRRKERSEKKVYN